MSTIDLHDDITPWLAAQAGVLGNIQAMNRAAAEGALVVVQEQFRGLSVSNRNPYGARGGFWGRMLAGTKADATAETGIVRMPREVALRYFGGDVKMKDKLLALPARVEAYGKSPRQFNDLHFVKFRSGTMALVQAQQTTLVREKGGKNKGRIRPDRSTPTGGGVFFWLKEKVTIRGDRGVLPSHEVIRTAAIGGIRTYVQVSSGRSSR